MRFALALLGFFSFFLRIVDGGAIYFDPGDEEQPAFEACVGLALFLAFLVDEGIRPDIANTEGNQNLLLGLDCFLATADKLFSLGADHFAVDVGVFHAVCRAMEGCDGYGEERFTSADRYFADAIEVADTGGVQVEIFGFLGFDLHGSPCRSLSDHDYWGRVADNVSSSRGKGWAGEK